MSTRCLARMRVVTAGLLARKMLLQVSFQGSDPLNPPVPLRVQDSRVRRFVVTRLFACTSHVPVPCCEYSSKLDTIVSTTQTLNILKHGPRHPAMATRQQRIPTPGRVRFNGNGIGSISKIEVSSPRKIFQRFPPTASIFLATPPRR